ncbi:unnamed protein product [Cylicostephanus goldi]|uniref:Transmembrane protein n=1 Tax=Cylicostephanus goldi TaxID=71465 RepID=A0A3P6SS50_CYLGO|nr:unnamed protein product [Cylicostephanus goldi]
MIIYWSELMIVVDAKVKSMGIVRLVDHCGVEWRTIAAGENGLGLDGGDVDVRGGWLLTAWIFNVGGVVSRLVLYFAVVLGSCEQSK